MTFNLIGFDFYWGESLFGVWFGNIKISTFTRTIHKALFCAYYTDGDFILEIGFIRIIGRDI